jgi:hypothetical protein
MKLNWPLFLMMSCPLLMLGKSYAAQSQQPSAGISANDHAPGKNHPRSPSLTAANHPKQLPNTRNRTTPQAVVNLHPLTSAKYGGSTKGGLIAGAVNNGPPVRSSGVVRSTEALLNNGLNAALNPSLDNVHHRGANPAVVGGSANSGSANSKTGNTAAINGTHMGRKP